MLQVINTSKNRLGQATAEVVIINKGKSTTKHLIKKTSKPGIYHDSHDIPYRLNS